MATEESLTHIPLHQQCNQSKSTLDQIWKTLLHKTSFPELLPTSDADMMAAFDKELERHENRTA